MMSSLRRPHETASRPTSTRSVEDLQIEPTVSRTRLRSLELLVAELQHGLESLSSPQKRDVADGIDFYEEVSCFEIALIKRALLLAEGHQIKAARLLNLNPTTLNAKVRGYQIHTTYPTKPTRG
jgi:DNA-binding NtrC family response regulator